jgi:PAS domain S-box-containing protein
MGPPKAGENRLATMLDAIDLAGLILDPDGRIVYSNDALLTLTGWTSEETLGRDWFESFIPAEIRTELRQTLLGSIHQGVSPTRHVNEIVTRSGERRLMAWYNAVLRDEAGHVDSLAAMGRDRTELRAAELARQATEARLAAILGQLPGMLWTIDTDLRCTASLGAGLSKLGLKPNEIVGTTLYEFAGTIDPADPAIIAHHAALAGTSSNYEATFDDRQYACHVEPLRDPDGTIVGAIGISFDITEQRRATAALERSEDRLRRTLEGIDAIVSFQDHADAPVILSPQVERILGYRPDELTDPAGWRALVHPDDLESSWAALRSPSESWAIEYRMRRSDGRWIRVSDRGRRIERTDGSGPGVFGVVVDVTEQREADEARGIADARLRAFFDAGLIGVVMTDAGDHPIDANDYYLRTLGFSREEMLRGEVDWGAVTPPEWRRADERAIEERSRTGRCTPYEKEYLRRDGTRVPVLIALASIAGAPEQSVGFVLDISDRREAEERYRSTLETLLDPIVIFRPVRDEGGTIVDFMCDYANEAACLYNRMSCEEMIGQRLLALLPGRGPSGLLNAFARVVETGEPLVMDGYAYTDRWDDKLLTRISDVRGHRLGDAIVFAWRDVTERELARQALVEVAERDRLLIEESADGIFRLDRVTGAVLDVNPASSEMLGVTRDELFGQAPLGRFDRDPSARAPWSVALEAGETAAFERTLLRPDGSSVILAVRARILPDGAVMASARDITAERELEARLLQSQRLEAIGKLAGGIAHDFNNMLAAIEGYGELALASLPADSPTRADVEQVLFAADRAALLTRQLLAYSRRQVMAPEVLDPGAVIDRVVPMLGRLLGEGIELRITHEPGLWRVRADPGQLEQVLINLAVNARDAMPDGGVLAISAANVDPGDVLSDDPDAEACPCIRITVSDTGSGMDAALLGRIFEPFFTTKGPGKGSGMGLATVHGIVEQSGGALRVVSEPGRGTAFTIDLPRIDEPVTPVPQVVVGRGPDTGVETILLVEDEEAIRRFLERTLGQLGYTVRSAATGDEALDLVAVKGLVPDLLVTDVQMPGIQGPDLARRLRALRPGLPTLFISGYSEELVDRAEGDTARVLEKPFDGESLAAAVREALDAGRSRG